MNIQSPVLFSGNKLYVQLSNNITPTERTEAKFRLENLVAKIAVQNAVGAKIIHMNQGDQSRTPELEQVIFDSFGSQISRSHQSDTPLSESLVEFVDDDQVHVSAMTRANYQTQAEAQFAAEVEDIRAFRAITSEETLTSVKKRFHITA